MSTQESKPVKKDRPQKVQEEIKEHKTEDKQ